MKRGSWHMYYQIKQGRMRGREIHKMRARKPRDKIQDETGGEMKAVKRSLKRRMMRMGQKYLVTPDGGGPEGIVLIFKISLL